MPIGEVTIQRSCKLRIWRVLQLDSDKRSFKGHAILLSGSLIM